MGAMEIPLTVRVVAISLVAILIVLLLFYLISIIRAVKVTEGKIQTPKTIKNNNKATHNK